VATTKDRFRDQENLAGAVARLCARYGADAVLAEATKCKNRRFRVQIIGARQTGQGNRDRKIGYILLEIARRLEQGRTQLYTVANEVACSERDSHLWDANWTITRKLDDQLRNVAKGYVRRFSKESRLYRSIYLMLVASEANISKVNQIYTEYLIKIGKDNLNEPRCEADISEDFLHTLRAVVAEDVRRDREQTKATPDRAGSQSAPN
jgi:hypothetical protein